MQYSLQKTLSPTLLPVGIILGLGLSFALTSLAENTELDSGPRTFAYNGYLALDDNPFTGLADFQFTITDNNGCDYTEAHDTVSVFAGRFTVHIGQIDPASHPLPACVFDANSVYLQIAVRDAEDDQPHRPLAGRQQIRPVPFAYWTAEGSDVRSDGGLTISGGSIHLNGGDLFLHGGDITNVSTINPNGETLNVGGDIDAAFHTMTVEEINGVQTFNQDGRGIFSGGNVTIGGNLTAKGSYHFFGFNTPPNNLPRLRLQNNVAENTGIDDLNDYQLTLFQGNGAAATTTYGIGIEPNTLFFNVSNSAHYDFRANDTNILSLNNSTATTSHRLRVDGNATLLGTLTVTGATRFNESLTVNADTYINSQLLSETYDAGPGGNSYSDLNNNGTISDARNLCFLSEVTKFNANNDRCQLNISGGNWQYRKSNDGDCHVRCYGW